MTKKNAAPAPVQEESIIAYKGFDAAWKCRGMQYKLGETFEYTGIVKACEGGLHSCERPADVFAYYPPGTSRFAIVRASGNISRHGEDSKIASARLTVEAEIGIPEIISRTVQWVMDRCTPEGETAKGYSGAASATGNSGAASATGARGAASATGDSGAASATGYSGAAMASGRYGKAMGTIGNAIFLIYRDDNWKIIHAKAGIIGQDGLKPDVFYTLDESGNFIEA